MVKQYENILSTATEEEILAFLQQESPESVFHLPLVFNLYTLTKGYHPVYFVQYKDGKINGLMLVVIIRSYYLWQYGRRAILMQKPVIKEDNAECLHELISAYKAALGHKVFYTEFRNIKKNEIQEDVLTAHNFVVQERVNLYIDFGSENTFELLSESKKRQVNKSAEAGVSVEPFTDIYEVGTFYGILRQLYRHKIRKPLPDKSFFISAFRLGRHNDSIQLLAVKYNRMVIGGILLVGVEKETFFEWYIGGLHEAYKHLFPSVMATWGGIRKAEDFKAKRFDFMGGGIPGVPYGVRDFKARFGSEEEINFRWKWTKYPGMLKLAGKVFRILKF
ncbi:GNAT family N-acetyltransferase [Saccharicrinis sp. FJH54]|uniref:GNAT family N-acetyltransferase n=1 Tax=Saccharicrinis sp. FJH54 TaxID=3344665 RepID=UPI0035D51CFE